ncbi:MAG: hypothetical protein OXI92_13435 [Acidobacteriota bacterium]|nr:hypothetical protein [Acidobacteriota bacterium]
MKVRRSLGVLAVFLMTNGTLLGSEPEGVLQVRWGELGKLIGGKKVALQLAEGARVEGWVGKVEATSLTINVKKSSNPSAYPKGRTEIPSDAVSRIEVREAAKRLKQTALTIVGALGAFIGGALIVDAVGPDGGRGKDLWVLEGPEIGAGIAIGAFVAVLMNLPRRSRNVTLIEVVPVSPGERGPKPTDKGQSSRPNQNTSALVKESLPVTSEALILPAFKHNSIGAAVSPLVVKSSQERLRQQARRAVMRQGIPLHLSSLSERRPPVARHAED